MNYIKSLMVLVIMSILACVFVSAGLDANVVSLKIDGIYTDTVYLNGAGAGTDITAGSLKIGLEKGNEIEVVVAFIPGFDGDVEVEAELSGDGKKDKVIDSTDEFAVHQGTTYKKTLNLVLPSRMDQSREYMLRITLSNRSDYKTITTKLDIISGDHSLTIKDIVLSPENEVKAGRALLATARIKNMGAKAEEDIKVKASVPALGISASDYIDELDEEDCTQEDCDDSTTSEELYMRIPDCAEPGEYTVKVCVEFDDGDEEECQTTKINVVESDTCSAPTQAAPTTGKTIITIGPDTQDVAKGGSVMYPITIANQGTESKIYSIGVDSADWADFSVTPSNVLVVNGGESKAAFISVDAKPSAAGLQVFSVTIKSGESVLKQVPLRANIAAGTAVKTGFGSIKKALEVGLVILVVLLVILGLIIGFNKLKGSEDEEEMGEEKTYY